MVIGTLVYVIALSSAGYALGGEWAQFNKTFSDVGYVLAGLVVIAIIGYIFYRLREFRKESAYAAKHGGSPQVRSGRERSGRLCAYRAGRGSARDRRRARGDIRDLRA